MLNQKGNQLWYSPLIDYIKSKRKKPWYCHNETIWLIVGYVWRCFLYQWMCMFLPVIFWSISILILIIHFLTVIACRYFIHCFFLLTFPHDIKRWVDSDRLFYFIPPFLFFSFIPLVRIVKYFVWLSWQHKMDDDNAPISMICAFDFSCEIHLYFCDCA